MDMEIRWWRECHAHFIQRYNNGPISMESIQKEMEFQHKRWPSFTNHSHSTSHGGTYYGTMGGIYSLTATNIGKWMILELHPVRPRPYQLHWGIWSKPLSFTCGAINWPGPFHRHWGIWSNSRTCVCLTINWYHPIHDRKFNTIEGSRAFVISSFLFLARVSW